MPKIVFSEEILQTNIYFPNCGDVDVFGQTCSKQEGPNALEMLHVLSNFGGVFPTFQLETLRYFTSLWIRALLGNMFRIGDTLHMLVQCVRNVVHVTCAKNCESSLFFGGGLVGANAYNTLDSVQAFLFKGSREGECCMSWYDFAAKKLDATHIDMQFWVV